VSVLVVGGEFGTREAGENSLPIFQSKKLEESHGRLGFGGVVERRGIGGSQADI
jgi:hypothetical protein